MDTPAAGLAAVPNGAEIAHWVPVGFSARMPRSNGLAGVYGVEMMRLPAGTSTRKVCGSMHCEPVNGTKVPDVDVNNGDVPVVSEQTDAPWNVSTTWLLVDPRKAAVPGTNTAWNVTGPEYTVLRVRNPASARNDAVISSGWAFG
jgi:hypothetical protein